MRKERIIFILGLFMMFVSTVVSVYATACLYNSEDVGYDNTNSGLQASNVQGSLDELYLHCTDYTEIREMIYPVGSIYISVTDSTVAAVEARFGGTWEAFGQGRTLIGAGTGTDSNSTSQSFAVNSTGGEYTHTLTSTEAAQKNLGSITSSANNRGHTHTYDKANSTTGSTTLTANQIPSHFHYNVANGEGSNTLNASQSIGIYAISPKTDLPYSLRGNSATPTVGKSSSAGGGQGHTHTISTTSTNSGAESQNQTHTVTISGSDASNAHNIMQPYITVYMYKRTA